MVNYATMKKLLLLFLFVNLFACQKEKIANHYVSELYDLSADAFMAKYKATKDAQLVDVRTQLEYADGHIQYAILIDYNGINFKKELIQKLNKSKPVFLYCRSGNRSKKTVEIMQELGFKEINNLNGGYNELIQFTEEC
jgi:rhodanese-related sulfurtransferase